VIPPIVKRLKQLVYSLTHLATLGL